MLKHFINVYRKIRKGYLRRSPEEKWILIRNIGIFFLKISGVPFLDPNFEIWWYSYIGCVGFASFFSSCFYTLWYYSDTPMKGLLPMAMMGIIVPVC